MSLIKKIIRKLRQAAGGRHEDPALNTHCTEFEVNNWVISDFIVNRLVPIVGTHPYPVAELDLMVAAVCRLKPQQIFEWGTNIGKSARVFYETGRRFGIPLEIHSIDLPDNSDHREHPRSRRGFMVKGINGVTLYQADGLSRAIELYQQHPANRTLVFIDGDHSYESVYRELNGVINAMPNASILLHDTFYQSAPSGYNIGPHQAIKETLAAKPGGYRVLATMNGLPGMTLLYNLNSCSQQS